MDPKQRFQQDLREAMRAKDHQRVSVLRILLDELDDAQKNLGIQAFDAIEGDEVNFLPDRQQIINEQAVQDIIRNELQRRREFIELMITGGQKERAEREEIEIVILEEYIRKI